MCVYQVTSSSDGAVVAKTDIANNGSTSEIVPSGGVSQAESQPAIGQICGIQRDGRLDVLWVDGSRSTTYLHQLYVIADEVLKSQLCLLSQVVLTGF